MNLKKRKIAIIGTVGIPANYGGFETLAENLARYHHDTRNSSSLTVWCSSKGLGEKPDNYLSSSLRYINLNANGLQSIPYDILSLLQVVLMGYDRVLILGVSGALFIPFVRLFSRTRIITNIDGIEWRRNKWGRMAKAFLRLSEAVAVKFSHEIISDNAAITQYVELQYKMKSHTIAYGGDHALDQGEKTINYDLPDYYSLALCRIEPENNVHVILEAFSKTNKNIVFMGNWENSDYGMSLKAKYERFSNIWMLNPIYDTKVLYYIRTSASNYIHGHFAGGTNPSLVEMMHFGIPVIAFDCSFNKYSTEESALYFDSSQTLRSILGQIDNDVVATIGPKMLEIAKEKYTWGVIGRKYFDLLD
jgi:glycosyltransferase involved in cell wall biosynthesis